MVATTNIILLYPSYGQLCPSVRAAEIQQVGDTTFSAIEGEIFAHNLDWLSSPWQKFL
jgi:hypothetical protein